MTIFEKNVIRDKSKAVVSKDANALDLYKKQKNKNRQLEQALASLNNLEKRVAALEELLRDKQ